MKSICDTIEQPMQNTPTPMQNNKQYSNLSKEEKDKLHSKCCEGTNKEQKAMVDKLEEEQNNNK